LPIAKNKNISKTAVTFLVYDNMFLNSLAAGLWYISTSISA